MLKNKSFVYISVKGVDFGVDFYTRCVQIQKGHEISGVGTKTDISFSMKNIFFSSSIT